jgi:hypothetical protein
MGKNNNESNPVRIGRSLGGLGNVAPQKPSSSPSNTSTSNTEKK